MGHWWRAYDEAVDDPKLQRLPAETFRSWFNLMCLASRNGGKIPPIEDVAFSLRKTPKQAAAIIADLRERGLIDEKDGHLTPHNWDGRQFKSDGDTTNAARQKRYRDRQNVTNKTVTRDVDRNVTDNVTDKRPDTEQITERKKDAADAAPDNEEKELFTRGKAVLGKDAGGLIAKLLKAKNGQIPLARAAVEQASTKQNPREYVGKVLAAAPRSAAGYPEGII